MCIKTNNDTWVCLNFHLLFVDLYTDLMEQIQHYKIMRFNQYIAMLELSFVQNYINLLDPQPIIFQM